MGRRLPWKSRSDFGSVVEDVKEAGDATPTLPTEPRTAVQTPPTKCIGTPSRNLSERLRSPSTSPPPEPPPESFMIPGPLHDDRYRMVEDEFLSTAQLFTAHLHRAEYNRLKTVAKAQNAAAIREIERPVVGSPTKLAKQRRDAFRRTQKQREQLGHAHERALPRITSGLQGLMDTPSRDSRSMRPFPQAISTTRAAAGFRSTNTSLGLLSTRGSALPEIRRAPVPVRDENDDDLNSGVGMHTITNNKLATTITVTERTRQAGHGREDEDDEDDPFGIQERRLRREKSREQLRKTAKPKSTNSPDVIPTFL